MIMEHMIVNRVEVKKEEWVESSTLAVERCFICSKLFYSDEDLDEHNKLEIHCRACKLCTTADNFKFDFCAAMGHLAGELKLDEVMKKFSEVPI